MINSMLGHEAKDNPHSLHDQIERLKNKLEMSEAIIAGDSALINGLKDDISTLEQESKQMRARNERLEDEANTYKWSARYEEVLDQNNDLKEKVRVLRTVLIHIQESIPTVLQREGLFFMLEDAIEESK
jgi:chromosome segregation ATPase